MKIVVFGLSISSAWGNGHATLLRGLFRALCSEGHEVHFFERDAPYYAAHRDAPTLPYVDLHLYSDWAQGLAEAESALAGADVGMVTSYCPDGLAACKLILESRADLRSVFYDMDTPVTLSRLAKGELVPYIPAEGLKGFDLVLSYTGGEAIQRLKNELKARRVAPLYGWVDQNVHSRVVVDPEFVADLSYLGTFSRDRQDALETLLISAARIMPDKAFIIAGAMYESRESWPNNIRYFSHVSPPRHSGFYSSSTLTLSVTRGAMAAMGYCPSGRLFEAAACGTPVLSDWWNGLDTFFEPKTEILIASTTQEAMATLMKDRRELQEIGIRAKERALDCHTAEIRARRFIDLIETPVDESGTRVELPEPSLVSRDV